MNLRPYIPALPLFAGFAFLWHTSNQTAVHLAAPLTTIFDSVTGYRIQPQKVGDEERRIAGMSDYIAQVYWRDTIPAFTVYVGYYESQTQGRTIHSPRNCLPGAGWEVLSGGLHSVQVGPTSYVVNRYVLKNGPATAIAYYWYEGRGRVVASEYRVKWNLLRDAALLGHTEEALARIIVPINEPVGASGRTLYWHNVVLPSPQGGEHEKECLFLWRVHRPAAKELIRRYYFRAVVASTSTRTR
jgi:EpsI family protein